MNNTLEQICLDKKRHVEAISKDITQDHLENLIKLPTNILIIYFFGIKFPPNCLLNRGLKIENFFGFFAKIPVLKLIVTHKIISSIFS